MEEVVTKEPAAVLQVRVPCLFSLLLLSWLRLVCSRSCSCACASLLIVTAPLSAFLLPRTRRVRECAWAAGAWHGRIALLVHAISSYVASSWLILHLAPILRQYCVTGGYYWAPRPPFVRPRRAPRRAPRPPRLRGALAAHWRAGAPPAAAAAPSAHSSRQQTQRTAAPAPSYSARAWPAN
jgi:hypothetical protein